MPRKPLPPVTSTRRVGPEARHGRSSLRGRVVPWETRTPWQPTASAGLAGCVTLEQCWHRVPGGTASAALEPRPRPWPARGDLDLVGVSARHRRTRRRPRGCPPIPVRPLPAAPPGAVRVVAPPAPPGGGAGHRPGRRHPRHRHGHAAPLRARWSSPCTTWPSCTTRPTPPAGRPVLPPARRAGPHRRRRGARARRRPPVGRRAWPPGSTRTGCALVPLGRRRRAGRRRPRSSAVRRGLPPRRPYVLWTGTVEPRKNLPGAARGLPARSTATASTSCWSGPRAGTRSSTPWRRGSARVRRLGLRPRADELRALYAGAAVFCLPSLREGFGLPRARGHGPGRAGGHLVGHGHRGGGRRRGAARRPARRRRARPRPSPPCSTTRPRRRAPQRGLAARAADVPVVATGRRSRADADAAVLAEPRPVSSRPRRRQPALARARRRRRQRGVRRAAARVAGPARRGRPRRHPVREPGFVDAHPDLVAAFPDRGGPADRAGGHQAARVAGRDHLARAARPARDRLDLLHHIGGTVPPWPAAPAVVTIHDLQPFAFPEHFARSSGRYLGDRAADSVRRAAVVVALTRVHARHAWSSALGSTPNASLSCRPA